MSDRHTHLPHDYPPPLRPGLEGHRPYGAPQVAAQHVMNVNENPYPPSRALIEHIQNRVAQAATQINRYPDRECPSLRASLATYLTADAHKHGHGITPLAPENIFAANGSNEIMQLIFQAFGGPGRRALGFAPHYSMYPEYARNTVTQWLTAKRGPAPEFTLDTRRILEAINAHEPHIVVLTSPNNPTGSALEPSSVSHTASAMRERGGILVVDEAYAEFRRHGVPSALRDLHDNPNVFVVRTMAKAFALAGARVGYVAAAPAYIDALRIVRLPYHLSAVTQAVAEAALDFQDELLSGVQTLCQARDHLAERLNEMGFTVAASDANFLLFGTVPDRHALWQGLLERGVLIREVGPPGWLRVSVGTRDNNEAFVHALSEVVNA